MNELLETALDALAAPAAPEGDLIGRAWLLLRPADSEEPELVELTPDLELVIGRSADHAELVIDSSKVSRRHAGITHRGAFVEVRDFGSLNGTHVGSSVLRGESLRLRGGDQIRIGDTEILIAVTRTALPHVQTGAAEASQLSDGVVLAEPSMKVVFALVQRLAPLKTTVLIEGESGVGKQVVAEHLHQMGPRARGPFVHVNCAGLPESLAESELFGHERGSFTGADRRKIGYFEAASGGTLFLDEIAELSLAVQAKLLVALEKSTIVRVGGTQPVPVDTRIVCATHDSLAARVKGGGFREDLLFRLSAFKLQIPPLRERPRETLLLAELFMKSIARAAGHPNLRLDDSARRALSRHDWPGNVRELRNAMEHAFVVAEAGVVSERHLPSRPVAEQQAKLARVVGDEAPLPERHDELERQQLAAAMTAEGGNQTRAARRLGISRRALMHKLDKFSMSRRFGASEA